ncbi:hypothetical protein ANH9381_1935 [Aggregatibacter actinomycetemcomitans ANH9381]|nr:hypothetical protein ANH9381_1935 [Aggregatibacter actinomycetemcomitans ANH9381]
MCLKYQQVTSTRWEACAINKSYLGIIIKKCGHFTNRFSSSKNTSKIHRTFSQ